jgi:DNA-binding NarL/FixJ family response regulator
MSRVFLLEDHASFRETLAIMIEHEPDLEVVGQAGSLAELRGVPRESWGEVDVALMDLLLSDGTSTEVIGLMREANPALSVLALTIVQDPEVLGWAQTMGADQVVSKEASIEEILGAVRRAAGRR